VLAKFLRTALAALMCSLATVAGAAFDPVMDDTDIFMVNPSIAGERPNILIVLDTTANWSQAFAVEKSALVSVVNSLSSSYNVGLMQFTGGNIDGAYVRFAVRQMSNGNKSALSTMVNNLTDSPATNGSGDKTNNSVPGLSMVEVYRYFKGLTSFSGANPEHEVRTDYTGNTSSPLIQNLAGNAFSAVPTSTSTYNSPVIDGCQKNFVIYISNGPGGNQTAETSTAKNELATAKGVDASALTSLPITPSGYQTQSWMDEWTDFLANHGFTKTISGQQKQIYVNTYVLEIDPTTSGQGDDWTALLRNAATQGKGKYRSATSGNAGAAIVEALTEIFSEIQSVNSVFASTTLPVSVNVRGTNLNQVYIGMFRPDANKAPRWYGNLKLYQLAVNTNNGVLYLADAASHEAENPNTGFITSTARSFWTANSTFWSFRSADQNGPGGDSDSPDGDLVEKGAAAQKIRTAFATSQDSRNLFTCTSGCDACTIGGSGTAKTCTNGSSLSDTPFATSNANITNASLGLGIKDVSPLTAKQTKTITTLTDRRPASVATLTFGSVGISSFANGGTTKSVTSLTTAVTKAITALSAATTPVALTIGSVTVVETSTGSGGGTVWTSTFTVTTSAAHGYSTGGSVTIAGNTVSGGSQINGTYTISEIPTTTQFRFTMTGRNIKFGTNGTATGTGGTSTTARATVANHGYSSGQSVTIAGSSPSAFNGTFSITVVDANTFTYILGSAQGAATTLGTATANTTTATATAPAHGFSVGNTVVIAGANPSGYNGTVTITAVPSTDSFTYTVGSILTPNTATGVLATKGATTTVVVTTSSSHNFSTGNQVTISGADSCYNVAGASITVLSSTTFRYTTATPCAANTTGSPTAALTSTSSHYLVVEQRNHGFQNGDPLVVEGSGTAYALGNYSDTSYGPTNPVFLFSHFGITTSSSPNIAYYCSLAQESDCLVLYQTASPVQLITNNSYTVRSTAVNRAYAYLPAHGYSTGDNITIAGADQAAYNGTFQITVLDANNFYYSISSTPGPATTSSSLTASINTTTAVATSINHGFADGSTVDISGASPSAFNGTKTITVIDSNTFRYTLSSPQGDATGTIVAAAGTGDNSERDAIIEWVRGQDNAVSPGGENANGSMTDCRASVHGDVLHSRPAVINYNRYGGDNDVYVFYGSNDGVFRGIKGGMGNDASDPTSLAAGGEAWGFVPTEGFSAFKRMRNNSPAIGSSFKKPYFLDGPIGVYTKDTGVVGKLQTSDPGDAVYLYVGARRGGRMIYSLDVTNPTDPKYRWKIDSSTTGFGELGYTWSRATVVTNIQGYTNPILIFGGGYDPAVEDIENCTITSASANSVTYTRGTITYTTTGCTVTGGVSTTVNRTMGRAIYIVDAITGQLIWSAGRSGSGATIEVPGMDYAIPSDVTVIRNESVGGKTNRAYVGDTGGNIWRIDFSGVDASNNADPTKWKVTKMAAVGNVSTAADRRKFLFPPDIVFGRDSSGVFYQVMLGSGDREHPFDATVVNRFYSFKDRGNDLGPATGTTYSLADTNLDGVMDSVQANVRVTNPVINHTNTTDGQLYDATENCIQQNCSGTTDADTLAAEKAAQVAALRAADGWFVTLGAGEKVVGSSLALANVVFFNTNQPSQTSDTCTSNLGVARQYAISVTDATAVQDKNTDTAIDKADRSGIHPGGGYLPSPVHVVVQIGGSIYEGVISGTSVQQPPGTSIGSRTRRFWYKEMD